MRLALDKSSGKLFSSPRCISKFLNRLRVRLTNTLRERLGAIDRALLQATLVQGFQPRGPCPHARPNRLVRKLVNDFLESFPCRIVVQIKQGVGTFCAQTFQPWRRWRIGLRNQWVRCEKQE